MSRPPLDRPGTYETAHDTRAFGTLRYTVSLPPGFPDAGPFPLVIALHYGFDRSAPFAPYYGRGVLEGLVAPALGELGAILAAPDSHGEIWTEPALASAVLELTDQLCETLPVDPARRLLTGFSLGGIGTWHIAGLAGGRFGAAVSVAAAPPPEALARYPAVPLYVIHSEADEIFPIARVDEAVAAVTGRGTAVRYERVRGVTHFDVPGFVPALRAALPWIRDVWDRAAGRAGPAESGRG